MQVGSSAVVGRPADMDDGPNRSNENWLQMPEMPCFGSENRIGREEREIGKLGFERLAYCVSRTGE